VRDPSAPACEAPIATLRGMQPESPAQLLARLAAHCLRHDLPPPQPANRHEIALLRLAVPFELPQDLLHWLSLFRGGVVSLRDIDRFYGTDAQLSIAGELELDPSLAERRWVPIANDGCGDLYCLVCPATGPRPVVFVDHELGSDSAYMVASGLFPFLQVILSEPENDDDPNYEPVYTNPDRFFEADPAAAAIRGFRYAWQE